MVGILIQLNSVLQTSLILVNILRSFKNVLEFVCFIQFKI